MLNLEQIPSQGLSAYLCSRYYVVPTKESPQKNRGATSVILMVSMVTPEFL